MSMDVQLAVVVEGGVVQNILSNVPADVLVIDHDNPSREVWEIAPEPDQVQELFVMEED